MGMNIARKAVLKKGGMGMSADGGWGLKSIKSLEKWDKRIKVVSAMSMGKGMYKGLPLKWKLVMIIPDLLGMAHMVHVRVGDAAAAK